MSDLWADACDLRLGLRCMQSVVRDAPWITGEHERILALLRQSRQERRRFLAKIRSDLFFPMLRRLARSHP